MIQWNRMKFGFDCDVIGLRPALRGLCHGTGWDTSKLVKSSTFELFAAREVVHGNFDTLSLQEVLAFDRNHQFSAVLRSSLLLFAAPWQCAHSLLSFRMQKTWWRWGFSTLAYRYLRLEKDPESICIVFTSFQTNSFDVFWYLNSQSVFNFRQAHPCKSGSLLSMKRWPFQQSRYDLADRRSHNPRRFHYLVALMQTSMQILRFHRREKEGVNATGHQNQQKAVQVVQCVFFNIHIITHTHQNVLNTRVVSSCVVLRICWMFFLQKLQSQAAVHCSPFRVLHEHFHLLLTWTHDHIASQKNFWENIRYHLIKSPWLQINFSMTCKSRAWWLVELVEPLKSDFGRPWLSTSSSELSNCSCSAWDPKLNKFNFPLQAAILQCKNYF